MNIHYATFQDKAEILRLWKLKENRGVLGIPFNKDIDNMIQNKNMFVAKINEKIIGFGGYHVMKRNPEIRIEHLYICPEYRNHGYAMAIIGRILDDTKNINLDLTAKCRDGMPNNSFYEKISSQKYLAIQQKTITTRKYILDKDIIYSYLKNNL